MTQGSHRHPVDVEAVGLLQHGKSKAYVFKVLWSDRNQVPIYRALSEFKKLQRDLKKQFPLEAGVLKKSERIIPKLKDPYNPLSKKRESQKCLETLRRLETFSQNLLKLDAKISQCSIVVQFFTLQNHDLNPSFHENSLVIVPSEKKEERPIIANHNLNVSGPLVCPSYLCIDDYETVDLKCRPFIVKKHQILDVVLKDVTGWWLVENADRRLAWFPAPYLSVDGDAQEDWECNGECQSEGSYYVVVKAYKAQNCDEVTVSIGAVVEVWKKSNNGYWLISYNGRTGYIPSIILKSYVNPCDRFQNILRRESNNSTPSLFEGIPKEMVHPRLLQTSSLQCQSNEENEQVERQRSKSLGCISPDSKARSYVDSDADSLMELSSSASGEDFSSIGSSNLSLSNAGIPKIPTRPNPNEIMQKCSTVTRRAVERSLARISLREAELRQ
uniref:NADPH oxidase organizer 1 n=1 Tax=Leptobrachium leishanense TaxID=445787 RepID=A0A8C5QCK8_9ANUR